MAWAVGVNCQAVCRRGALNCRREVLDCAGWKSASESAFGSRSKRNDRNVLSSWLAVALVAFPGLTSGPRWLLEADVRCADVGQRRTELLAGADPELSEHLAQVPLHRARTEEQLGPDLRVRLPAGSQARDLHLLRGQLVERLDRALTHCLAGGQQLAAGALGERLHAHVREHRVSGSQLLAGVDATVLAPQPFAIQEVRAGQRRAGSDVRQPFDRLPVEPLGGFSFGQHRRRARVGPERPVRAGGMRYLSELGERTGRALRLAAARGCLDELR